MTLRDRVAEAMCLIDGDWTGEPKAQAAFRLYADAALSVLAEGIEIVTPHREGCEGGWMRSRVASAGTCEFRCTYDPSRCPAVARIPEALLVELVEAREVP